MRARKLAFEKLSAIHVRFHVFAVPPIIYVLIDVPSFLLSAVVQDLPPSRDN